MLLEQRSVVANDQITVANLVSFRLIDNAITAAQTCRTFFKKVNDPVITNT